MNIKQEKIDEGDMVIRDEIQIKSEVKVEIKQEIEDEEYDQYNQDDLDSKYPPSSLEQVVIKTKDELPENKYKCAKCAYSTDFKNNLTYHMIYRHTPSDQIKYFPCPVCKNYKGKTKVYLRRHMKKHGPRQYKCTKCDYASKCNRKLENHVNTKHEFKEKHKCMDCRYSCYSKEQLDDHFMQKHVPDGDKRYFVCPTCSFKTTSQRYLTRHQVTKHNPKKFQCTVCDFSTKYNCNLKQHMYARHIGPSAIQN